MNGYQAIWLFVMLTSTITFGVSAVHFMDLIRVFDWWQLVSSISGIITSLWALFMVCRAWTI